MSEVPLYGGLESILKVLKDLGSLTRFRGGLVLKAHRLCVSLISRLERNNEEKRSDLGSLARRPLLARPAWFDGHQVNYAPKSGLILAQSIMLPKVDVHLPVLHKGCRVTSLTRNRTTLGPYSRLMPRALWWS